MGTWDRTDAGPCAPPGRGVPHAGLALRTGAIALLVASATVAVALAAGAPKITVYHARPETADAIAPDTITAGANGYLWFVERNPAGVGRINSRNGAVKSFSIPNSAANTLGGIAFGPSGFVWVAAGSVIDRITPASGAVKSFALPANASVRGVSAGPDGNLWFADGGNASIGRLVPSTGAVSEYPEQGGQPDGVTSADGDVWFTDGTGSIGKVVPSTGALTQYRLPSSSCNSGIGPTAYAIVAGPDHNLWFTTYSTDEIGRLNPSTGAIKEHCLAHSSNEFSIGIAPGLHGDLWFTTESVVDRGGSINPSTGAITRFTLTPELEAGGPAIAEGPGADLWVTLPFIKQIARLH